MGNGRFRLGVVGLGHRGIAMFELAKEAFGDVFDCAAICDCNESILSEAAAKFPEAAPFSSFTEMLDKAGLDVLLVETPATCHAEFCIEGRRRGLNVFSDIPSVATVQEGKDLWLADKEASGGIFMTGANPNMYGFIQALYDYYQKGYIGKPYYLEAEYIHDIRCLWPSTPWRRTLMPIKYCTHSLGPLLRITDEDLRQVSCMDTGAWTHGGDDEHDLMTAHFHAPSGLVFRFTASFINNAGCGCHSYRVFGTEGYFERLSSRGSQEPITTFNSKKLYGFEKSTVLQISESRPEYEQAGGKFNGHGGADYVLWAKFAEALKNCAPSPLPLKDGLRMTIPGIYAAESAMQGGRLVDIEYPWD